MLKVLINAYACSPNWGSEPGMAWNWCSNLAKYCEIFIITEGEWKNEIEEAIKSHPYGKNMHFYYNPLPEKVRKMCWNQGDWRFYYYYRQWQKKTLKIAEEICKEHKIDILHQLNMIGFREPGLLWKIKGIPFVWGPIGGMELMSTGFLEGESIKLKFTVFLKNCLNNLQRHFQPNVRKALQRADALSAATKGVYDFIRDYYHKYIILLNETGCYERELPIKLKDKETFDIVWVGKFDYRKQLGLAIKTIACLKDCDDLKLHIIGTGTENEIHKYKLLAKQFGVESKLIWHGKIPNLTVQQIMRESDLFLFTSIMEGTPHVVLEAIQNALPVVCFDACGQSGVVNNTIGVKIKLCDEKNAIVDFSNAIRNLYNNKEQLFNMSENCSQRQKELSWDSKAQIMLGIYNKVMGKY
jgi:glycosyltransferase involved in cell wall biosynthesis